MAQLRISLGQMGAGKFVLIIVWCLILAGVSGFVNSWLLLETPKIRAEAEKGLSGLADIKPTGFIETIKKFIMKWILNDMLKSANPLYLFGTTLFGFFLTYELMARWLFRKRTRDCKLSFPLAGVIAAVVSGATLLSTAATSVLLQVSPPSVDIVVTYLAWYAAVLWPVWLLLPLSVFLLLGTQVYE